jgi:hypothetical protein
MKKIIYIFALLAFTLASCEKNELEQNNKSAELFENNEYNTDLKNFTLSVLNAIKENKDFRHIVKNSVIEKFDGDYNVLVKNIVSIRLPNDNNSISNRISSNVTIGNLLENYLQNKTNSTFKVKSEKTSLEVLLEKYPNLQIAIPYNAEEWDSENYIPIITFVPSEFKDGITEFVTGYDFEGNNVNINAKNLPGFPVIVINENERFSFESTKASKVSPSLPTSLTGTQTESGIRLTWSMSIGSTSTNTSGYYIYRKGVNDSEYILINTVYGVNNRSYDDNNVFSGATYSYYVISFYLTELSEPSNYITLNAPNNPKPVQSFEAKLNSLNEIELRWQNDYNQYILETRLYKYVVSNNPDYMLFKTYTSNDHNDFDRNIVPGTTIQYKINHYTSTGLSNPKYDIVKVPFRDISQNSPVYIKAIGFKNWDLESWLLGFPEFYVKVLNVDFDKKTPYTVQDQINLDFGNSLRLSFTGSSGSTSRSDKTTFKYKPFNGVKVLDWNPSYWYDLLTFHVIEYDYPSVKLKLDLTAKYNQKKPDSTGLNTGASAGATFEYEHSGNICGYSYLNYYDNTDKWLVFPNYGVQILVSVNDINDYWIKNL